MGVLYTRIPVFSLPLASITRFVMTSTREKGTTMLTIEEIRRMTPKELEDANQEMSVKLIKKVVTKTLLKYAIIYTIVRAAYSIQGPRKNKLEG